MPDVDDHNFIIWSNWKAALTANSSQDAELEHTLWARVHPILPDEEQVP